MKGHTCQPIVIALIGIIVVGQWGCALKRLGGPRLEEVRAQRGVIGVASPSNPPPPDLRTPSSGKGVAAAHGAGAGLLAGVLPGAAILQAMAGCSGGREIGLLICGPIAAFGLGLAAAGGTLGALTGALYGAANAEAPAKEVGEAVKNAAAELQLQQTLRDSVLQAAVRQANLTVRPSPIEPAPLPGDPKSDSLHHAGVDTILEVALTSLRLTREGPGANPPVTLVANARARLVRSTDGRELYRQVVTHRSATRRYEEWAADDARHLKEALGTAFATMADEIIDILFVRSEPPRVTVTSERSHSPVPIASAATQPTRPWAPAPNTSAAAKQWACQRQYLHGWADWRDRLPQYHACVAR